MVEMHEPDSGCDISKRLACFAVNLRLDDIPPDVVRAAKYHLLDTIGVALAASSLPDLQQLAERLSKFSPGQRHAPGMVQPLSERDATLMFGMLVHGIEFDDTSVRGRLHPSAFCAPPALVLGASMGIGGAAVLTAYIAGIEAGIRLGAVARGGISELGFDPTGIIGAIAASIVSALIMGEDQNGICNAIAMACSLASGNMEYLSELTFTKRLHAGNAASAGISAAILGGSSIPVPKNPLSGRFGLYPLYTRGATLPPDLTLATQGLGREWLIATDLAYKPMPLCFFNIPATDAALILRQRHAIAPAEIAEIIVHIPKASFPTIAEPQSARRRPTHRYAAQFSVYYAVACALIRGGVTLGDFSEGSLNDPAILSLIDMTNCVEDMESNFPQFYSAAVEIVMTDGRRYLHRESIHRGSPKSRYSEADIEAKFRQNAGLRLSEDRASQLFGCILEIETLPNIGVVEELAGPA